MTPKELIEAFETLADAQDGVARLRELVLALAVRGKLVSQNSAEEPASALLEKFAAEKARQVKGKKSRVPKELPPIEADDVPFSVPESWEWVRLGESGAIFSGNSIPAIKKTAIYSKVKAGRPYIATKDVGYGREELAYDNGVRIPSDEPKFKVAEPGAVLVCSEGGSAGRKVGFVRQRICFGNKLIANQPHEGVVSEYLFHFCQSPGFQSAFRERMTGIIGGIALGKFLAIEFPLPPLAEQHRIVSKVDELMALLDRMEAAQGSREATRQALRDAALSALRDADAPETVQSAWTRIAEEMDHLFADPTDIPSLRETILQLAVQGRLVASHDNDEPANKLLDRIASNRAQLVEDEKIKNPKTLPPVQADELPFEAPKGWVWAMTEDISDPESTTTYGILKPVWVDSGVLTVRISEMKSGVVDVSRLLQCEVARAEKFGKTTLATGDLLITKDGTIGKTAFVPPELAGGNITQHVIRLRVNREMDRRYIRLAIDSPVCQEWMRGETKGVALKGVNVGDFRRMPIPVPPLVEQERIVAKVGELMAHCDDLESRLKQAQDTSASFAVSAVGSMHE